MALSTIHPIIGSKKFCAIFKDYNINIGSPIKFGPYTNEDKEKIIKDISKEVMKKIEFLLEM